MKLKKILAVICSAAVLLCATTAVLPVSAAEGASSVSAAGEGLTYSVLADGTAKITRYYKKDIESYTAPETIAGRVVTAVGQYAFSECTRLKSVTLPDSVKIIDAEAFEFTPFYENSANYVGGALYAGNHLIKVKTYVEGTLTVREGTTSIAEEALLRCKKLTGVSLPDSLKAIDRRAFSGCTNITAFDIPSAVDYIGTAAFLDCASITSIALPEAITEIAFSMFNGCTSLEEINYSSQLKSIEANAFKKTAIKSTIIPEGMTTVPACAFSGCKSLETADIPDSVKEIGEGAFESCPALQEIVMPDSVERIKYSAFQFCSALKSVTFSKNLKQIDYDAFNSSGIEEAILPDSVTLIGWNAFYSCSNLKNVRLPDGCTEISGIRVFAYNNALKNIDFMRGVKVINKEMFTGCRNLDYLTIPEGTVVIQEAAFSNCDKLRTVMIPEGVKELADRAFCNYHMEAIFVPRSVTSIGVYSIYGGSGCTVYGYSDSYVQRYAEENGCKFVAIDAVTPEELQKQVEEFRAEAEEVDNYFNPENDETAPHPRYTQATKNASAALIDSLAGKTYQTIFELAVDRAKLHFLINYSMVDKSELAKIIRIWNAETNDDNYYDEDTWKELKIYRSRLQIAYDETTTEEEIIHDDFIGGINKLNKWCAYTKVYGDLDHNGKLTIGDVTVLQRALAENGAPLHIPQIAALNAGNGTPSKISIKDATAMQRVLAEYDDNTVPAFEKELALAENARILPTQSSYLPKHERIYQEDMVFLRFLGAYYG